MAPALAPPAAMMLARERTCPPAMAKSTAPGARPSALPSAMGAAGSGEKESQ